MKWVVDGTDEKTGLPVVVEVEASHFEAAEQMARDKGLLVSNIKLVPSYIAQAVPSSFARKPYEEISESASLVRTFALIVGGLGWFSAIAGLIIFFCGFASSPTAAELWVSCGFAAACVVIAVFCLAFAALLRLLSGTCVAVGDIARSLLPKSAQGQTSGN